MIAADASSLIAFLDGVRRRDTETIDAALAGETLFLPPPVVVELVGAEDDAAYLELIASAPQLPLTNGYWNRARETRRLVRSKGLRARALDTLVAQCCIDSDVPLIAHDSDFRHFERWCGLKLAVPLD